MCCALTKKSLRDVGSLVVKVGLRCKTSTRKVKGAAEREGGAEMCIHLLKG